MTPPETLHVDIGCPHDVLLAAAELRDRAARLGAGGPELDAFDAAAFCCAARMRDRCGMVRLDATLEAGAAGGIELRVRISGRLPAAGAADAEPEPEADAAERALAATVLDAGTVATCRIRQESARGIALEIETLLPANADVAGDALPAHVAQPAGEAEGSAAFRAALYAHAALLLALRLAREDRDELHRLRRELDETNRGVVALYAELEERADELRRADQAKTRFLSNVSHELRTPLNSIRALSGLLLDRLDGPLGVEQEKQVQFIRAASEDLRQIVDELLDLAKIAAGKTEVRAESFEVGELFGTLRGMLKPLLTDGDVALEFEAAPGLPPMHSDEAKLSHILRNLVSNALKFTQRGEVRVRARSSADASTMHFVVSDTGIGIAAEDRERIFEEFVQIAHPLQARSKGTGLGLPLCRRLAALLGGSIQVQSEPGRGSQFTVVLPRVYVPADDAVPVAAKAYDDPGFASPVATKSAATAATAAGAASILIIDDDPAARYALRRRFEEAGAQVAEASDGAEGLRAAGRRPPDLVLLDLRLPDMDGDDVLMRLRATDSTRQLRVAIVTSVEPDAARSALIRAQGAAIVPKRDIGMDDFCERLLALAAPRTPPSTG